MIYSKQMSDVGLLKVYCDLQCEFYAIYIYFLIVV
jgi:hypothetical protein